MKATKLIAVVMAVSAGLVVLGGILNSASVVAIFTGVMGKQDGDWFGVVALLLGLAILGVFIYAYKQAIWNWYIRGGLIGLSVVIFLVSAIGMAENIELNFGGTGWSWSSGGEVYRVVTDPFIHMDLDLVVLMMLLGSIGVAVAALWGAFRWESAKNDEVHQDGIRDLLDELPPEVLQPGVDYREEIRRYYGAPSPSQFPASQIPTSQPPNRQPADSQPDGQPTTVPPLSPVSPPLSSPPPPNSPSSSPSSVRRKRCPRCWTEQYENARFCHSCGAGS